MKTWAPWVAFTLYALLVLAVTLRAWLKVDAETAGKVLALGLALGVVLWRAWLYIVAIILSGSPFARR